VSELLVAGHSPAVTQYSVRKRVSPTHAYLTLASSGKSFTEQSAASSLANCGQASSAPMDSENRNSPVEKQGKDSAEDVSTNVTFRPQRANKSAEARIKAAFTEVSGSSGTVRSKIMYYISDQGDLVASLLGAELVADLNTLMYLYEYLLRQEISRGRICSNCFFCALCSLFSCA